MTESKEVEREECETVVQVHGLFAAVWLRPDGRRMVSVDCEECLSFLCSLSEDGHSARCYNSGLSPTFPL